MFLFPDKEIYESLEKFELGDADSKSEFNPRVHLTLNLSFLHIK